MKILIVTTLFPPDLSDSSRYCKELSKRLVDDGHSVEIILYGKIPEKIEKAHINVVRKSFLLPVRLLIFTVKYFMASLHKDRVIISNGPAVDFPTFLIYPFVFEKATYLISDSAAVTKSSGTRHYIYSFLKAHLPTLAVDTKKYLKPEIHPFKTSDFSPEEFNENWKSHLRSVINYG